MQIRSKITGATFNIAPSANLTGADLTGADLTGANLTGADLTGADLTGADLRSANLTGADLRSANLTGANLRNADLTFVDLTSARLRNANLTGAHLPGTNLTGTNLNFARGIVSFGPVGCVRRIGYVVAHGSRPHVQLGCFWGPLDAALTAIEKKYGPASNYAAFVTAAANCLSEVM